MSSHWEEYAEIQANEKASQPQREPTHLFVTDWGRIDYCAKCGDIILVMTRLSHRRKGSHPTTP